MLRAGRGLAVAEALYAEIVEPVLGMPHAACLIGEGSEVLGFDTDRSADHEWGPRLQVFVATDLVESTRDRIDQALPEEFDGLPTRWFSLAAGRTAHHVEVDTTEGWLRRHLPTLPADPDLGVWLAAPQQHLLQLTAGAVFRDDLGDLTRWRETYRWYPVDLWRWLLASQWRLIGSTEPLLGRTIETGDERGSRLLVARLCRLMMEMAFLQQRRYQPYAKWFGRGFADLAVSRALGPLIDRALTQRPALGADGPLQQALLLLSAGHNALGVSDPVEPAIAAFEVGINDAVRPYPVLNTAAIIEATLGSIRDSRLADLPRVGAIDQFTHADDLLVNFTTWPTELAVTYRQMLDEASR